MPTIMQGNQTQNQPAVTPSGPKVVLTDETASQAQSTISPMDQQPALPNVNQVIEPLPPVQEPTPLAFEPEPIQPAAIETPSPAVKPLESKIPEPKVEAPKILPAVQSDALDKLIKEEEELTKQLQSKHQEESGLLDKMTELIKETGAVEMTESELQKKLSDIQKVIYEKSNLDKPQDVAKPEEDEKKKIPEVKPAPMPSGQVKAISPEHKILNALQHTFANTDATIAAVLSADAIVQRSSDKDGVIVANSKGQIHFSNADLKQANISGLMLSDIPFSEAPSVGPTVTQPSERSDTPASDISSVQDSVNTKIELTTDMQELIAKIKPSLPPEQQAQCDSANTVYRSPDMNGVLIVAGNDTIHVSDAELIQSNITGENLTNLPSAPLEMLPADVQSPTPQTINQPPATDIAPPG